MIIGIDGPAGSGKTTVARLIAEKLNILYLDTGATYRVLTLKALNNNLDLNNEEVLGQLAQKLKLKFEGNRVYLDETDVSDQIRTSFIDKNISIVVSHPKVREVMVRLQRDIVSKGDFVVEGRDITTVVFPKAEYKFYLDAQSQTRAKRRFRELKSKAISVDFQETEKDLVRRDYADKNRKISPLIISDDAVYVDTTDLAIEDVVNIIIGYVKK